MSDINPYRAPEADVVDAENGRNNLLDSPAARPAAEGWLWIKGAFSLFAGSPGMWILITILLVGISIGSGYIPLGNIAFVVFSYVFVAGLMLGCGSLEKNGSLGIEHLFAGFRHRGCGALVICGAIVAGLSLVIGVVIGLFAAVAIGATAVMSLQQDILAGTVGMGAVLIILTFIALTLPLVMMTWFAPALIVFHQQTAWDAMKLSFQGCLKNIVPFLFYGLAMLALYIVAAIPLGLGFLVMGPVTLITMYTTYRAVFTDNTPT